jgi:predicted transcriptional regulator
VKIDPAAVPGKFSKKLVVHEEPEVAAHLEEIASTVGISTAALIRSAVRDFLRRVDQQRGR